MKTITKKAYGKNIKITDARDNFSLAINNAYGNTEQDGEPTPDVPIEIKSVVLSEIKTCRKNLFKCTSFSNGTQNGVTLEGYLNEQGFLEYFTLNGTCTNAIYRSLTFPNMTLPKGSYVLNGCPSGGGTSTYRWYISTTDGKTYIDDGSGVSFTFEETTTFTITLVIYKGAVCNNVKFYPMISVDGGEFEPYTESVATLSNPITLNGIGDVQDYVDVKRGVLVQKFKEVVFNGSESGWKQSSTYNTRYFINISDAVKNGTVLCTQGIRRDSTQNGSIRIDGNLNFSIDTTFTTLAEWKSHLASKPMEVTYELATPIETPLPEADVEALKSLKTYDGVTHIFTDSEIKPELEVEYTLLEAKNEWRYTDYFQHTDYNRIASNINYLKAYLDTLFAELTNTSTIEEKTAKSLIYAREINAIETALETLNLETYKIDIGETKEYMANTRTLNFEDLNRIESAIFMLAEQMTNHKENLSRLAFRLGGQKGIRV